MCSLLKFKPLSYQKEFLMNCRDNKRILAVFSRQSGKSTCVAIYCIWHAIMYNNNHILIISPTQEQSNLLFNKIRFFIEGNLNLIKRLKGNIKFDRCEFYNKSTIKALPTGDFGTTIRGHTADLIILEESGYIKNEIKNEVIYPMGASSKNLKIIQIGTPKGKNQFYRDAMSDRYKTMQIDYKLPVKEELQTMEFIEEQRDNLTDMEFRTEYCAEFIEDQDAFFKQDLIDSCIEDINLYEENTEKETFNKDDVILGIDLARMGADSSVIIAIEKKFDEEYYRVVFIKELQHKLINELIGWIKRIAQNLKVRKIFIDETGIGAGARDVLKEQLGGKIEGFRFTTQSKQELFSNLQMAMERGLIKYPPNKKLLFQLADLRYEMTSDEKNMKIHHSDRGHDDFVDSLALACLSLSLQKRKKGPRVIYSVR